MNAFLSNGWLLALALLIAVADWYAVARRDKKLEYLFKPAALIGVLAGAWLLTNGPHDEWQAPWFLLGFAFSLAGDIFLMLPGDRYFLPGLVAFLLGQACFVGGLNPSLPPPGMGLAVLILIIAVAGLALFSRIAGGLRARGQTGLVVPVAVYSLVISLMLLSAWATLLRPDWDTARRVFVCTGATLFFASDSLLAWDKFVRPFANARLFDMVLYHLGQLALAASIALWTA